MTGPIKSTMDEDVGPPSVVPYRPPAAEGAGLKVSIQPPHLGKMGLVGHLMRRAEIEGLAASIRVLLADPDAGLNEPLRRRWEGALIALETVLGQQTGVADTLEVDLL
jgi:hypothetical protein